MEVLDPPQTRRGLRVQARLPAGQYRVDGDYSDAERRPLDAEQTYHYRQWLDDQRWRRGVLARNDLLHPIPQPRTASNRLNE